MFIVVECMSTAHLYLYHSRTLPNLAALPHNAELKMAARNHKGAILPMLTVVLFKALETGDERYLSLISLCRSFGSLSQGAEFALRKARSKIPRTLSASL